MKSTIKRLIPDSLQRAWYYFWYRFTGGHIQHEVFPPGQFDHKKGGLSRPRVAQLPTSDRQFYALGSALAVLSFLFILGSCIAVFIGA